MIYRNLYSERKKEKTEDVFSYNLPENVRNGIFSIIKNHNSKDKDCFSNMIKDFCENHLLGYISDKAKSHFAYGYHYTFNNLFIDLHHWILSASKDELLDFIEVIIINMRKNNNLLPDNMITVLNDIFQREMIGFEIIEDQIVHKDNEFLHQEVVKKPLAIFKVSGFDKAEEDFLRALKAFADKNYASTITNANSAFESTMKRILNKKEGEASSLIKELIKRGLIPKYLEKKLQLPTLVRHKDGDSHGRLEKQEASKELAQFAVHSSGTNIVFLLSIVKKT